MFFLYSSTVVVQEFEVRVYDEYVIRGNTAVLRCVVPPFVRDLVTVTAWVRDHVHHIYPSLHGGKYNGRDPQLSCIPVTL